MAKRPDDLRFRSFWIYSSLLSALRVGAGGMIVYRL